MRRRNSRASRLLPMPGGPLTEATAARCPRRTSSKQRNRFSSSLPRPTNGVCSREKPRSAMARSTSQLRSGPAEKSKLLRASSALVSSASSWPACAVRANAEAVSTASPAGRRSSTSARPVATPTRAPFAVSVRPSSNANTASPPWARRVPRYATIASLPSRMASAPRVRMRSSTWRERSSPLPTPSATIVVMKRLTLECTESAR